MHIGESVDNSCIVSSSQHIYKIWLQVARYKIWGDSIKCGEVDGITYLVGQNIGEIRQHWVFTSYLLDGSFASRISTAILLMFSLTRV